MTTRFAATRFTPSPPARVLIRNSRARGCSVNRSIHACRVSLSVDPSRRKYVAPSFHPPPSPSSDRSMSSIIKRLCVKTRTLSPASFDRSRTSSKNSSLPLVPSSYGGKHEAPKDSGVTATFLSKGPHQLASPPSADAGAGAGKSSICPSSSSFFFRSFAFLSCCRRRRRRRSSSSLQSLSSSEDAMKSSSDVYPPRPRPRPTPVPPRERTSLVRSMASTPG